MVKLFLTVRKGDFMVIEKYNILKLINKRKMPLEKTKDTVVEKKDEINLRLNLYNSSLLICSLAFLTRYMYYGKVEDVELQDYFGDEDYMNFYYQIRLILHYLNETSKKYFGEDYEEYKVCGKYKKINFFEKKY